MPASRLNYIIIYKDESQVYGTATKEIALETPLPPGQKLENKRVLFVTYQPDGEVLSVHPIPQEEVLSATLKEPTKKKKKEQDEQEA